MEDRDFHILVSLDALLDTRIATVAKINPDLAVQVLKGNYADRRSDFFPVNKAQYDELYRTRDSETLARARCTNMVFFLNDMVSRLTEQRFTTPFGGKVYVTVNFAPYQLTETTKEHILTAVSGWVDQQCPIQGVEYLPEELTPSVISKQYDVLIMYDYQEWLEINTAGFEKTPLLQTNLYVPAISFTNDLTNEMIQELREETGRHPFEEVKFMLAPFISLEILDVVIYNIISPVEKRHTPSTTPSREGMKS